MGHTQVPDRNNALYGFKTDLKSDLSDGDLPYWLEKHRYGLRSGWEAKSLSEIIELAAEKARERRQKLRSRYENPDEKFSERTFTEVIQFKINKRRAPNKIVEKMGVSREEAQDYTGRHHVNGREYRLQVEIGVRGGISDIQVVRDFHH